MAAPIFPLGPATSTRMSDSLTLDTIARYRVPTSRPCSRDGFVPVDCPVGPAHAGAAKALGRDSEASDVDSWYARIAIIMRYRCPSQRIQPGRQRIGRT